jgi:FG-GAP-like repeat
VVADVNNDGKPDLLTLDGSALSVYLGKGDGTFTQIAPNFTQSVQFVGDFNGDGKPDILWSVSGTTVYVALGNGDGTFRTPALMSGLGGDVVGVGAFNSDGKLDLAIAVPINCTHLGCSFTFGAQLGKGDGTFQLLGQQVALPSSTYGINPPSVAMGDLNQDGKLDVVYASTGQIIGTLQGNGDGTFTPANSYGNVANNGGPEGLAITDLNGDHKLDIVGAQGPYGSETINIMIGGGDGTFAAAPALLPRLVGSLAAVSADFNADGKPDVALLAIAASPFFWTLPTDLSHKLKPIH